MYFRLLSEVFLTKGKKKSFLSNILNKKAFWIENDFSEVIIKCENNEPVSPTYRSSIEELAGKGWGTITNTPIFVDKLRLYNVFNEKKFFKDTPYVNIAFLKLTNVCNMNCDHCGKMHCPVCLKGETTGQELTLNQWEEIIVKLKNFGCGSILLTGGEVSLYKDLERLYDFVVSAKITPFIVTNGIKKITFLNEHANIIITFFHKNQYNQIIKNYGKFKNITILSHLPYVSEPLKFPNGWKVNKADITPPKITLDHLANGDIIGFYLRKDKNQCLNSKIVITEDGTAYPCLGSIGYINNEDHDSKNKYVHRSIGKVYNEKWEVIIKNLVENYWYNKVYSNHIKCNGCEFKYVCASCLFCDAHTYCTYNPEGGLWML